MSDTNGASKQSLLGRALAHIETLNADRNLDWHSNTLQFERLDRPARVETTVYYGAVAMNDVGDLVEQSVTLPLTDQQYNALIGCVGRGHGVVPVQTPAEMRYGSQVRAGVTVINAAHVTRIERHAEVNVVRVPRPDADPKAARSALEHAPLPF